MVEQHFLTQGEWPFASRLTTSSTDLFKDLLTSMLPSGDAE